VNAVAPQPVAQAELARALGRALGRPALVPVPALAIRLALGEQGEALLLDSARIRPARLLASGFAFADPELEPALTRMLAAESQ
jgi:NAD dependent epimerase/dehydratase family enzyme